MPKFNVNDYIIYRETREIYKIIHIKIIVSFYQYKIEKCNSKFIWNLTDSFVELNFSKIEGNINIIRILYDK